MTQPAFTLPDKFRECRVHWQDHCALSGWQQRDAIEDFCKEPPIAMQSLGWLIYECDDYVVLALTVGERAAGELLKIGRSMITDMMVLKNEDEMKLSDDIST